VKGDKSGGKSESKTRPNTETSATFSLSGGKQIANHKNKSGPRKKERRRVPAEAEARLEKDAAAGLAGGLRKLRGGGGGPEEKRGEVVPKQKEKKRQRLGKCSELKNRKRQGTAEGKRGSDLPKKTDKLPPQYVIPFERLQALKHGLFLSTKGTRSRKKYHENRDVRAHCSLTFAMSPRNLKSGGLGGG